MKILLPTDFSENSKRAIHYALQLFNGAKDEFHLVSAYHLPHAGAVMMTSVEDLMRKSSMEDMATLENEVRAAFPDLGERLKLDVVHDEPYVAIQRYAEKVQADLIAMGTTGASGMKKVLMGSVTAQLVKNAERPTLAIPAEAEYTPPKKIALASNGSETSQKTLAPLRALALKFGSKVEVCVVNAIDKQESLHGELENALEGVEHEVFQIIGGNVDTGILGFVEEHHCDMLATVHRQYGAIRGIFHKSVSKQVALHTRVPLLVLSEK